VSLSGGDCAHLRTSEWLRMNIWIDRRQWRAVVSCLDNGCAGCALSDQIPVQRARADELTLDELTL
jgi:hypothetical protein